MDEIMTWLKNKLASNVNRALASMGLRLVRTNKLSEMERLLCFSGASKSQIKQDLFVLSELQFRKNGYFVEFGATNGYDLSNTYLLEKYFDWTGILAEPAKCWHAQLYANRSCIIEQDCVWEKTGAEVLFSEADDAEYSTISSFEGADFHDQARKNSKQHSVRTISLEDMLVRHNAPKVIDYLSIDTEGSELTILQAFDFDKYKFRVITCEHNFTDSREEIRKLLESNGYVRKYEALSRFDDWYVYGKKLP